MKVSTMIKVLKDLEYQYGDVDVYYEGEDGEELVNGIGINMFPRRGVFLLIV